MATDRSAESAALRGQACRRRSVERRTYPARAVPWLLRMRAISIHPSACCSARPFATIREGETLLSDLWVKLQARPAQRQRSVGCQAGRRPMPISQRIRCRARSIFACMSSRRTENRHRTKPVLLSAVPRSRRQSGPRAWWTRGALVPKCEDRSAHADGSPVRCISGAWPASRSTFRDGVRQPAQIRRRATLPPSTAGPGVCGSNTCRKLSSR